MVDFVDVLGFSFSLDVVFITMGKKRQNGLSLQGCGSSLTLKSLSTTHHPSPFTNFSIVLGLVGGYTV